MKIEIPDEIAFNLITDISKNKISKKDNKRLIIDYIKHKNISIELLSRQTGIPSDTLRILTEE